MSPVKSIVPWKVLAEGSLEKFEVSRVAFELLQGKEYSVPKYTVKDKSILIQYFDSRFVSFLLSRYRVHLM